MFEYVKGYLVLALYILVTKGLGLSFWRISADAKMFWLIGAVALLLVVFWPAKRVPTRQVRG